MDRISVWFAALAGAAAMAIALATVKENVARPYDSAVGSSGGRRRNSLTPRTTFSAIDRP